MAVTLNIDGITKSYGTTLALHDFTMEMTPGVYALLGPNGSGKSTLMNILTDNLRADGGHVYLNGRSTPELGSRYREMIGYMPQYPGLYPHFTVGQFMRYMAALKGVGEDKPRRFRRKYVNDQIETILREVELNDVIDHRVSTLSGGMKQRLGLAQAVLGDPQILILDEPTAGLDPRQRIAIRNFIAKNALDKIVLIATHVVADVESIADRVILLKKGEIVETAAPDVLMEKMKGHVWTLTCPENKLGTYRAKYRVTNIAGDGENVVLRVITDGKPTEDAVQAEARLEDFYLSVFGE